MDGGQAPVGVVGEAQRAAVRGFDAGDARVASVIEDERLALRRGEAIAGGADARQRLVRAGGGAVGLGGAIAAVAAPLEVGAVAVAPEDGDVAVGRLVVGDVVAEAPTRPQVAGLCVEQGIVMQ